MSHRSTAGLLLAALTASITGCAPIVAGVLIGTTSGGGSGGGGGGGNGGSPAPPKPRPKPPAPSPPAPPAPPGPSAPSAPSALAGTVITPTEIELTWTDGSTDETGFRLERSVRNANAFSTVGTPAANATAYDDLTATPENRYDYRLFALNGSLTSGPSNVVSIDASPAAPSNLAASIVVAGAVDLTWSDNSSYETAYRVERSVSGQSAFSTIATLAANATSRRDSTVSTGTTYDYRIVCTTAAGAPSTASSVVTIAVPSKAPTLASISPRFGLETGGRVITLEGLSFNEPGAGATTVRFGANLATNVQVIDDTTVQCTTPAAAPSGPFVNVTVSNANGSATLPLAFTYAVTLLEETFSSSTLPPALEDPSGSFQLQGGVIRDPSANGSDREYVRTVDASYADQDFVYELTVNVGADQLHFPGMGSGEPDASFSDEPANSLYYRIHSPNVTGGQVDVRAHPTGSFVYTGGASAIGFLAGVGPQRVRVEKVGKRMTFTLCRGWNGVGPYTTDMTFTFEDIATTAPYVTNTNSRLFFGGAGPSSSFDDLVIATIRRPGPGDPYVARGRACAMLSWDPVPGATSYTVYRSTTAGVTPLQPGVVTTSSAVSPLLVDGLAAGTTYHFVVTATVAASESSVSQEVSVTPLAAPPASPGLARQLPVTFSSINDLRIDPVRWMAYAVDEATNQLVVIDLVTEAEVARLTLSSGTRMLSLSPSLRYLVVVCDVPTGTSGHLYLFDPETRTQTAMHTIDIDAFDIEVLDDAAAYVPSNTQQHLAIYDVRTGASLGTWGSIATKTLVRRTPDQRRIYGNDLFGSPPDVYAWLVPGGSSQTKSTPDQTQALDGTPHEFVVNSDGTRGLTSRGVLVTLGEAAGAATISTPIHTFTEHCSSRDRAVAPGLIYGLADDTGELILYDLVNLTAQRSAGYDVSLSGNPRHAVLGPGGRLYAFTTSERIVVMPVP